ncbi:tail protein X [Candidatus Persebacteraceae bacterium Df01]|jgi:phage tail protein X|uniref:Tail protein X n=1 Tax=Candidatus Doriopsillibacter californiensis TaxID=2970740 RepID=A0ABT7QM20_9GAMM|nr:tail protein X [Candidatus Persebacteraceae bacterium Df01]
MANYHTTADEHLDAIVAFYYGVEKANTALRIVLDANPRLAYFGVIIPKGVTIKLPAFPSTAVRGVALWD